MTNPAVFFSRLSFILFVLARVCCITTMRNVIYCFRWIWIFKSLSGSHWYIWNFRFTRLFDLIPYAMVSRLELWLIAATHWKVCKISLNSLKQLSYRLGRNTFPFHSFLHASFLYRQWLSSRMLISLFGSAITVLTLNFEFLIIWLYQMF